MKDERAFIRREGNIEHCSQREQHEQNQIAHERRMEVDERNYRREAWKW